MIKNKTTLEYQKDGRLYQLIFNDDSPVGELHDVLMHMKGIAVDRMAQVQLEEEATRQKMKEIDSQQIS